MRSLPSLLIACLLAAGGCAPKARPPWRPVLSEAERSNLSGDAPGARSLHRAAIAKAPEGLERAEAYAALGQFALAGGRAAEAAEAYAEALSRRESAWGAGDARLLPTLQDLAAAKLAEGRRDVALALYARALTLCERSCSPRSLASALERLGLLHSGEGAYERAEPLFARALALLEKDPADRGQLARVREARAEVRRRLSGARP